VARDLINGLNDAWGEPKPGIGGGTSRGTASDAPVAARLRFVEGAAFTLRGWSLVLKAARELRAARRLAFEEVGTGGALLWSKLRKAVADTYGRIEGKEVYRPFTSRQI
jgi:hypothetical protein